MIHPEIRELVVQFAYRLGGKTTDQTQPNKLDPNLSNQMKEIAKKLHNANLNSGSVDQFIVMLMSQIATFTIPGAAPGVAVQQEFNNHASNLNNLVDITFKSAHEIIMNLFGAPAPPAPAAANRIPTFAVEYGNLINNDFHIVDSILNYSLNPAGPANKRNAVAVVEPDLPVAGDRANLAGADAARVQLRQLWVLNEKKRVLNAAFSALFDEHNVLVKLYNEDLVTLHNEFSAFIDRQYNDPTPANQPFAGQLDDDAVAWGVAPNELADPNTRNEVFGSIVLDFMLSKDTKTRLSLSLDKYFLNKYLQDSIQQSEMQHSSFFDRESQTEYKNQYIVKDGVLHVVDNGNMVPINVGSDKFKELFKGENKCYTTGINPTADLTCAEYIAECVMNGNIDKCKNYLKQPDFWTHSKEEVTNMLPKIALDTLKSLQFNQIEEYDELQKMNVVRVVSVNEWLQTLQNMTQGDRPTLSVDEFDSIKNNDKLTGYLHMLVDKINSNPQILNPTYNISDVKPVKHDMFKGTRLYKMGLKPLYPVVQQQNNRFTLSSINRLSELVSGHRNNLRLRLSTPVLALNPLNPLIMVGGNISEQLPFLNDEHKLASNILEQSFTYVLSELTNNNKTIVESDRKAIDKLIAELKHSEKRLNELLVIVDKYNRLLNIYGEKDGRSELSVDHLQKFVEQRNHRFQKLEKRENTLLDVLRQLVQQTQQPTQQPTSIRYEPTPLTLTNLKL